MFRRLLWGWLLLIGLVIQPAQAASTELQHEPSEYYLVSDPNDVTTAYKAWLSEQLTARAEALAGTFGNQCVIFARNFIEAMGGRPDAPIRGIARTVPAPVREPEVGFVVVTTESWPGQNSGHVGTVIKKTENKRFQFVDSNAVAKGTIGIREWSYDDPRIVGFLPVYY